MSRLVLLEEFHLALLVPGNLPVSETEAARRVLTGKRFRDRLGRAIRAVVRASPDSRVVRVRVSR